jgi:HSP20 family protein
MMMLLDTATELDRISQAFFPDFPDPAPHSAPMDLYREGDRYVVEVDLPGFSPASIEVSADQGVLTIHADRYLSERSHTAHWLVRERRSARAVRQLVLGGDVNPDAIRADYRNGVLRITLPMKADALPRKVAVTVGPPTQHAIDSPSTAQELPGLGSGARAFGRFLTRWLPHAAKDGSPNAAKDGSPHAAKDGSRRMRATIPVNLTGRLGVA